MYLSLRCQHCSRVRPLQESGGARGRRKQLLILVLAMCVTLTMVSDGNNLRKERFVPAYVFIGFHFIMVVKSLWSLWLRKVY